MKKRSDTEQYIGGGNMNKMTDEQLLAAKWRGKGKVIVHRGEEHWVIGIEKIPKIIHEAIKLKEAEIKIFEKCGVDNCKKAADVLTLEGYPMCDDHYKRYRFKWLNTCPECAGEVFFNLKENKKCTKCEWRL